MCEEMDVSMTKEQMLSRITALILSASRISLVEEVGVREVATDLAEKAYEQDGTRTITLRLEED